MPEPWEFTSSNDGDEGDGGGAHDSGDAWLVQATVFVRAIRVEAEIGIHSHEQGRRQPLLIDVEITLDSDRIAHIADTVNYETVTAAAKEVAGRGHLLLVESYAEELARACLREPRARRVRVRVEKPEALAPDAQGAGVELVMER